jgi:ubiquinone/menaquinone biosynthesis C-methylase UbiE
MSAANQYNDTSRAGAYARLGIVNSYYLAYRDLPALFAKYGLSGSALDYGCGTGRSTRFLRDQGFKVVGVDIADEMIAKAREQDPDGQYRVIAPGDLRGFADEEFNLVLSEMPFDNMPTIAEKVGTLLEMSRVLKLGGIKILVAASHDLYFREWVSWSTANFLRKSECEVRRLGKGCDQRSRRPAGRRGYAVDRGGLPRDLPKDATAALGNAQANGPTQ